MAAPAKIARQLAEARGFTEVHQRGRGFLIMRQPGTNERCFDASAGDAGWHYGATFENEVDTAWLPGDAVWQWRMQQAEYQAEAKSLFIGAPLVRYTDPTSGAWVTFQPRQLEYTNDLGSVQL